MIASRLALGCMRLSTEADRDEARAAATLQAALEAGIRTFDTARAYARDERELGHNERLVARAIRGSGIAGARIITKGGMRRPEGRWEPDGRAKALRADCEASVEALDGLPIGIYLLHAPDPRVPWATSVRALAGLLEAGLVRAIGLSNVTRRLLDEALAIAPVAAVQIAWSPFADDALRGGVVARCLEKGIEVLAHSPFGGPARKTRLEKDPELAAVARRHGVTAPRVVLGELAELHRLVTPVPGARRPETVAACIAPLTLDEPDRAAIEARLGWRAALAPGEATNAATVEGDAGGELRLVMGVQGAGKTTAAGAWTERGYVRMNRDDRGGTMKALHEAIGAQLAAGVRRIVADNTYTTRASRNAAIAVAREHGVPVAGVWIDAPVAEAQHNVILRMLEAHGRLLEPEEMARARDPSSIGPGALWRLLREVEPPTLDEGFASLQVIPFERRPRPGSRRGATFVALDAVDATGATGGESVDRSTAVTAAKLPADSLFFAWRPGATAEWIEEESARLGAPVACCVHPGGPARCWCRPPLPGLIVALAEKHACDLAKSVIVGTSSAHARMARALGVPYRPAV